MNFFIAVHELAATENSGDASVDIVQDGCAVFMHGMVSCTEYVRVTPRALHVDATSTPSLRSARESGYEREMLPAN